MSNNRLGNISKEWIKYQSITEYDVDWLICQVQELRAENKRIKQLSYRNAYEQGKFDTNMKVWYEMPRVEKQNERYREAKDKLDAIFLEKHRPYPSEYDDGYLDGLDRAIGIISESLEGEEC